MLAFIALMIATLASPSLAERANILADHAIERSENPECGEMKKRFKRIDLMISASRRTKSADSKQARNSRWLKALPCKGSSSSPTNPSYVRPLRRHHHRNRGGRWDVAAQTRVERQAHPRAGARAVPTSREGELGHQGRLQHHALFRAGSLV